jgi:hypothetical protein
MPSEWVGEWRLKTFKIIIYQVVVKFKAHPWAVVPARRAGRAHGWVQAFYCDCRTYLKIIEF